MGTEVLHHMVKRHLEVFEECHLGTRLVVEGYHLIEDGVVSRLLDVSHRTEDEPTGVIVETTTDVVVTTLGEGLVLVVAAAIGKLCRGYIDDALTCTAGNLMHKAYKVLVTIAEAHATPHTALEERSRTREVESNHALILIPDVYHAVHALVGTGNGELRQQLIPHLMQLVKSSIDSLYSSEALNDGMSLLLIYNSTIKGAKRGDEVALQRTAWSGGELLLLLILGIAQQEDKVATLTRLQRYLNVMRGDGAPAVSY